MKRRNFLRLFGAVPIAPLIPFKWNVHQQITDLEYKPEIQPTDIWIDYHPYSNRCTGLEWYLYAEPGSKKFQQGHLHVDIIGVHDFQLGSEHMVKIQTKDKVIFQSFCKVTGISNSAHPGELFRTQIDFFVEKL